MKRTLLFMFALVAIIGLSFSGPSAQAVGNGFTHGLLLDVDGEEYYMMGMPVGDDGASDIPGHYWNQTGPNRLVGKHYEAMDAWTSAEGDNGKYLYTVNAVIDEWSKEKAMKYASKGYVHYHEMIDAEGNLHPTKVVWLQHIARTSFEFEHHGMTHDVTPGIDWNFPNNSMMPYTGMPHMGM